MSFRINQSGSESSFYLPNALQEAERVNSGCPGRRLTSEIR